MFDMLLLIAAAMHLMLFILSIIAVKNSKDSIKFIYHWAFLYGAFVWEDLLLFSLYYFVTTMYVFVTKDIRLGLLFFTVFWIVRSAGETLYFFLQQFHQPTHLPHRLNEHFTLLRNLFGNISDQKCYILMQVFHQIILVISLIVFVLLFINWENLKDFSF